MEAAQQEIDSIRNVAQARIDAINETMNFELDSLRQSTAFRLANDKQKRIAEEKIRKKAKNEEKKIKAEANEDIKKQFKLQQLLRASETIMNTAQAIMKVTSQTGVFATPWIAAYSALGAAQLATINAQKAPTMKYGGLVGGQPHSRGGTMIEAERGEFVMSKSAVDAVGLETMNKINAGGSSGDINISFAGNVMSKDFIEDEAIPQIKEALRRGGDIGVG
jgi:hypothetical protein